jgi:hypothetical protein
MDFQITLAIVIALVRLYASIKHDHCPLLQCPTYNQHNTQCLLLLKNSKLVIFDQELRPVTHCWFDIDLISGCLW